MAYIGNAYQPKIVPDEVIDTKINRADGELTGDLNAGNNAINNISSVTGENNEIDFSGDAIKGISSINGDVLSGFRNKIINGNFDIWQRATSQTSSGYGSADRWSNIHTGSTKTVSRQDFTVGQTDVSGNPKYFMRHVVTSVAGAGNYAIAIQKIENFRQFAGKTVTVTFYAKADSAKNICNEFYVYHGSGGSPTSPVSGIGSTTQNLTTSWQKFSYTVDIPSDSGVTYGTNDDHHLELLFWFDAGTTHDARTNSLGQQSGTFDIAHVSVVEGDATLEDDPFSPRHIQQELALCQRYFQRVEKTRASGSNAGGSSTTMFSHNIPKMRQAPTLSHINVTAAYNWSNRHFANPTDSHVAVIADVTSGYWYYNDGYDADAEI
jgi:hypothetical protein